MKHKISKMQCLALHWDENGKQEPQCQYCEICKEPIRPKNFNDECEGLIELKKKLSDKPVN